MMALLGQEGPHRHDDCRAEREQITRPGCAQGYIRDPSCSSLNAFFQSTLLVNGSTGVIPARRFIELGVLVRTTLPERLDGPVGLVIDAGQMEPMLLKLQEE